MTDAPGGHGERSDGTFNASLPGMSLSELQDVFGHLDRDKYPERVEAVRRQMHDRIEQLGRHDAGAVGGQEAAGPLRRAWASLLDVFISLFPLVLYLGLQMLAASSGGGSGGGRRGGRGGGRGGRGRGRGGAEPEASWFDQAIDYVTSPEAVWGTVETYGPYVLGFMAVRALFTLPQITRSGTVPGLREAGVGVVTEAGAPPGWRQAATRFVAAYVLGILTLGISHLWAIWDRDGRTLFDRVAGTRAVRIPRRWEKPEAQRLLED